ncbi:hypothetical protein [Paraburkholderia tagetis]|uniref:Uncharacterized protein n=1 Tax=Paraburkholderia tagetis TaxID=2913261 RepID=A0A9X1UHC3_9BURK|nr:hypothetical protein [Paraburkholderia tagetis]MCG5076479.1 hypothetical protein [Paraburkholderia tagetis]
MTLQVDLPDGELIECTRLARAIALARLTKQGLTGIACVVGKVMKIQLSPRAVVGQTGAITVDSEADSVSVRFRQRYTPAGHPGVDPRLIQSGRPSGLLIIDEQSNAVDLFAEARADQGPMSLPYKLTDEDRALLVRLLPDLPQLQAPVTLEAREAFLDAYRAHPDRAGWEPELLSLFDPDVERGRLDDLSLKCQQELRDDFIEQRFAAFNSDHSRAKLLVAGAFIPRQMVLDYLKQRHDMVPVPRRPDEGVSTQTAVLASTQSDVRSAVPEKVPSQDGRSSKDKMREEGLDPTDVYEYHKQLVGKARTKRTAEYFEVSGSLVRRKIRQYKERSQPASPFPVPVNKK